MTKVDVAVRHELRAASDDVIADAVTYSNPMVLRGLLYQLTGDEELKKTPLKTVLTGYYSGWGLQGEDDVAMVRRKAVAYLKKYRDAGAGPVTIGPMERLQTSLELIVGEPIPDKAMGLYTDDLGLNPWARSLEWQSPPNPQRLADFSVTIIGAGMAGLNAALQLQRAGIPYVMIEKNHGVGGTWHENRYPGARVDTASRSYTHIFGADYNYPNPFCPQAENQKYFDWVADNFDVRKNIVFGTEVISMTWDEKAAMWEIRMKGPDGEKTRRSRAVMTAVGFLSRPMIPDIEGKADFQGVSWHTARWPVGTDISNKRIAVVGTGCTGYQMIPELALQAKHLTVFQRTPQWIFPVPGYRSPFPPQIRWLDRNFPFHNNFMRFRTSWGAWFQKASEIDPDFHDPHTLNADNKRSRETCIAFLESKFKDPKLVAAMTPPHPPWSARPVAVDPEYSVLDALQRDNVTLVTSGIERMNQTGIVDKDGVQHDVDIIVFATGFHATEYLFPMEITGKGGKTIGEQWKDGGARAYWGCLIPNFPNLWTIYGPNTNGGLSAVGWHEMTALYAMKCIERMIAEDKHTLEVKEDAYWRYNRIVDEGNSRKVWSDPRAKNYYWSKHGRSVVQTPLSPAEVWNALRYPNFDDVTLT